MLRIRFFAQNLLFVLVVAALLAFPAPAQANTYTVTNTNDSGAGSLRQALADAYSHSGDDFIYLDVTGTINLNSTLVINSNVSIDGQNYMQAPQISGQNLYRVFYVNAGVTASLSDMVIRNGYIYDDYGGGIYNNGNLTVLNISFVANHVTGTANNSRDGGAIYNNGTLTIRRSTFAKTPRPAVRILAAPSQAVQAGRSACPPALLLTMCPIRPVQRSQAGGQQPLRTAPFTRTLRQWARPRCFLGVRQRS
ncbi:MAG: hypothetical protein IPK19_13870 [Chloroflexi bacterium]|nr:hypothetical protein [Chloroflexota bacterium]